MRRRAFIKFLGGTAAAWPLAASAQQPKRVGVLMNDVETDARGQGFVAAFVQQLKKLGWIDGQNLHGAAVPQLHLCNCFSRRQHPGPRP
jgi:putative ABC transport system substrate-binding protein